MTGKVQPCWDGPRGPGHASDTGLLGPLLTDNGRGSMLESRDGILNLTRLLSMVP